MHIFIKTPAKFKRDRHRTKQARVVFFVRNTASRHDARTCEVS